MQEVIEVKKDSEHADSVRAMKQAWEEAEPGRAAKAKQSRLNYLSTHVVQVLAYVNVFSLCTMTHTSNRLENLAKCLGTEKSVHASRRDEAC